MVKSKKLRRQHFQGLVSGISAVLIAVCLYQLMSRNPDVAGRVLLDGASLNVSLGEDSKIVLGDKSFELIEDAPHQLFAVAGKKAVQIIRDAGAMSEIRSHAQGYARSLNLLNASEVRCSATDNVFVIVTDSGNLSDRMLGNCARMD